MTFLTSILNFIYPPACLHCNQSLFQMKGLFCSSCESQLELIHPDERCPLCFSLDYDPTQRVCYACFVNPPALTKLAAAFDYQGPAATLVTKLKYGNQPYLARGAGAYMAFQLMELGWPLPDVIIPVPLTLTHRISRGYNQSFLLAESLSSVIQRPVRQILKRRWLDDSQTGMSRKKRLELKPESFFMKRGADVRDHVILLVDDVSTTGQTLNCCAEVLYGGFPKEIYGLTFCKAM